MKNKIKFIIIIIILFLTLSSCSKKRSFNANDYSYHDGVSWVQLKKKVFFHKKPNGIVCIDENGLEIFYVPEVHINRVSNFYNSVAVLDQKYLINKKGEITHDLVDEFDISYIQVFPSKYFDGFIIVVKNDDGFHTTGILNDKLEYVIEPTTDLNGIDAIDNFLYYSPAAGYYDVLENEFIREEEFKIRHFQRSIPKSGLIFIFKDSENIFKYSSEYYYGIIDLDETKNTGFYNKNLELILDTSNYSSFSPITDFINGVSLVNLKTKQDKLLYGLIDLEGNFIFVETNDYIGYDSEKIEFEDCYYDWNGNYFLK